MNVNADLPWLKKSWQQLTAYIKQNRIPQALLIHGKAGLGKRQLIELFAKAVFCEAVDNTFQPCGGCRSCTLVAARTYPDLIVLEPEVAGKAIGIDKIRDLIARLELKPQFDSHRIVIIDQADMLNNPAANAFLKCLEEPTERTTIILVTDNASRLPATVRSRCQLMQIVQAESSEAVRWLKQRNVKDSEKILKMAHGSPLLAEHYAEMDYLSVYQAYYNDWLNVAKAELDVVVLAEQWIKQEKVSLSVLFGWILDWVVNIVRLSHQVDLQADQKTVLQEILKELDLQKLYHLYDGLLISRELLGSQVNKQLMVEKILIEWSRVRK